ncbi:MAG: hypothetical protein ABIH70_10245 [Chloroflexota bacterium]
MEAEDGGGRRQLPAHNRFGRMMKRIAGLMVIALCMALAWPTQVFSTPEDTVQLKKLNFVFLHGAGATAFALQLLADSIAEQLPAYIQEYEAANPGTTVQANALLRYYPHDVDIGTWANNIVATINKYSPEGDLILIGHSMGGKTALYTVANDIGGLAEKVPLVVTINSPIRSLDNYYFTGGVSELLRIRYTLPTDRGVINSASYYDSTEDGNWVGTNKHWLAFISAEPYPTSQQFDLAGVDPLPRDMDDGLIPISAQYSEGADVVYYGERGHSDIGNIDTVAQSVAQQILRYIFGGQVELSVFARSDTFHHQANWLPLRNHWTDTVGDVTAGRAIISHKNESYFRWQEWEDTVEANLFGEGRSGYEARNVDSFPFLTALKEARWLNDDAKDGRLYLRTRTAPRTSIQVGWSIKRPGLLPTTVMRDHYEIEETTGTFLTQITSASWATDNPLDVRLKIASTAEGPFRWLQIGWRVYFKEGREIKLIDQIPGQLLPNSSQ